MRKIEATEKYLLYARKSSESEDRQVASIASQVEELEKLAGRLGITIVGTLKEEQSAKDPGRPVFADLLKKVEAGGINGILCWSIDRLSRNPIDSGYISHLLQKGVIKHIRTYDRDYYPEDNVLIMTLEFGVANQFIRDLSKNTKRGLRAKLAKGILPSRAPLGYYNDKFQDKGEKDIKVDEKNFEIVKRCWTEIIETQIITEKLYSIATEEWGLRTHWDAKPGKSSFYRTFRNPFYYGWFRYAGDLYEGIHQPMISREQFDEVQVILNRSGKQHPKRHVFAFTGLMRCGECGAMITAETKSKKLKNGGTNFYTYYRCTKRLGPCSQKCLEEKVLTKQIQTILSSIEIPHSFCYWALDILKKENEKEGEHSLQRIEQIQREYRGVTKKLSGLIDMRAEGEISAQEFVSKKNDLVTEKIKLEELMRDREQNTNQWLTKAERILNFAETAQAAFTNGDITVKRNILSNLGQNLILTDRQLSLDLHLPLQAVRTIAKTAKNISARLEPKKNQQTHEVLSNMYSKNDKLGA